MNNDTVKELVLSVVIPAYNEEERLPITLKRIYDYLSKQSFSFEVFVVDDGSTDRTAAIAKRFFQSRRVGTVLENSGNRGKGFSVKCGVLHARGKYILFSDADLSTPIEELERLLQPLGDRCCDIAIASRAHKESDVRVSQPWYRKRMGQIFNIFVQLVAVQGIKDTQCGFKCFTRDAAMRIFPQQRLNGFGFDVEILYIARKAGYAIQEVPVAWINSPKSRVHPVTDSARMFFDLWRIRLNELRGRYSNEVEEKKVPKQSQTLLRH
jgi:dolichyl-phosphate beta-glucosyltransferase